MIYKSFFWRDRGFSGEILCANKDYVNNPIVFAYDGAIKRDEDDDDPIPSLVAFILGKPSLYWSDVYRFMYIVIE
jgi:hypothetical protein